MNVTFAPVIPLYANHGIRNVLANTDKLNYAFVLRGPHSNEKGTE